MSAARKHWRTYCALSSTFVFISSCLGLQGNEGSTPLATWGSDGHSRVGTLANDQLLRTGKLKPNQVVITIDESPHTTSVDGVEIDHTGALAKSLASGEISQAAGQAIRALFFVVGNRVAVDGAAYSLPSAESDILQLNTNSSNFKKHLLASLVAQGHYLANHSFSHPIKGASSPFNLKRLSFAELSLSSDESDKRQAFRELLWTDQVLLEGSRAAGQSEEFVLRLFRPPGGNWGGMSQGRDLNRRARGVVGGYTGPVGWTVPGRGQSADWQCVAALGKAPTSIGRARESAAACASEYVQGLVSASLKGLILFHGNLIVPVQDGKKVREFNYSEAVIKEFVRQARLANKSLRFVAPTCFISGC